MLQRTFTLIVALFLIGICSLRAQENESSLIRAKIKHGSLLLGGNLQGSYQVTSSELNSTGQKVDGRRIDFNLRSKNGYFILEDLVVGLDLSVLHQSNKLNDV